MVRLQLQDLTGGGGSSDFKVEDINDAKVVRQLGLDATAQGTTLTGNRLLAGLNSVLLRNLNGGQGHYANRANRSHRPHRGDGHGRSDRGRILG